MLSNRTLVTTAIHFVTKAAASENKKRLNEFSTV
jgi:hypothetical protein